MDNRELKKLKDSVRNAAPARLTLVKVNDGSKMQSVQATGLDGEVFDNIEHFEPYGFSSNAQAGEMIGLPIGGDRGHMIVLAVGDRSSRKKDSKPGEVTVWNQNGDFLKLSDGNKLETSTKEYQLKAETKAVIETEDCTVIASGTVTIKAPTVTIDGNLVVTGSISGGKGGQAASLKGNLAVDGNITATGSITP